MKTNKIKEIIKREANKVNVKSFNNDLLNNVSDDKSTYYFNNKKSIKPFVIIPSFLVAILAIVLLIFGIRKINNNDSNKETSLELLSFELKDENTNKLKKAKPEEVELDYSDRLFVVATVKNLNRYSFIDLVVFRSDLNTMVVYNEGNGKYQCQSETKYQDGMWVTIIEFELIFETIPENGYVSVDSINFLSVDNKQYKAGLSYAKSKEIRYTFIKGEDYTLNADLFDETNNIDLENIKSGTIYFNDDVKELNIDDINLDNVRFNNLQFVFNDNMNPFNIPVSYYKKAVNVYEENGILYLPSKTNKYYAVIDVKESNRYINENSKYVSGDIFDKDNVNKYYYDNTSKSYYLRSNNNNKFMLIKAGDGIINLDEIDILAYGISIKNIAISNDTNVNRFDFEANNIELSLNSLYVDSIDNLTNEFNSYMYDKFNENTILYVNDDSGSVKYNNKKYNAINELDINNINDLMLIIHLKQIKNININCDLYTLPTVLFGLTGVESIIINYPIESIKSYTFANFKTLKSIELPDSVKTIGGHAFSNSGLETIVLKEGIEKIDNAFSNCNIKNINIPNSIKYISIYMNDFDYSLFYEENGIYYLGNEDNKYLCMIQNYNTYDGDIIINEKTKVISSNILIEGNGTNKVTINHAIKNLRFENIASIDIAEGCESLFLTNCTIEELILPDSITNLSLTYCNINNLILSESITKYQNNFDYCEIGFNNYNGGYYIGSKNNPYYLLVDCYEEEIVVHENTKVIMKFSNESFDDLKSIVIPNGVEVLGVGAFKNSKIESIEIPSSITTISGSAFYGCENLKNVILPNTIKNINSEAFYGCSNLESINIPDSLESIYYDVFYGCGKLQYNLYNDGYYIGNDKNKYLVFVGCNDKKDIILNENTKYMAFSNYFGNPKSLIINEGVTEIRILQEWKYLENIVIPNSVTKIRYLFSRGLGFVNEIVVPETVVSTSGLFPTHYENLPEYLIITIPYKTLQINQLLFTLNNFGYVHTWQYEIIGNSIKIYLYFNA